MVSWRINLIYVWTIVVCKMVALFPTFTYLPFANSLSHGGGNWPKVTHTLMQQVALHHSFRPGYFGKHSSAVGDRKVLSRPETNKYTQWWGGWSTNENQTPRAPTANMLLRDNARYQSCCHRISITSFYKCKSLISMHFGMSWNPM